MRRIDPLKDSIASGVAQAVNQRFGDYVEPDGTSYEVTRATALQTQIRVSEPTGGPRYFIVQVKEML